jgi:threonine dehydratase
MQTETITNPAKTIGIDGCKGGWVVCWLQENALQFQVFSSFEMIVNHFPNAIIAVDVPVGLPDRVGAGGRGPEGLIRPLLGARKSSVFSIPSRKAVFAATYPEACEIAFETSEPPRKISKQGFFLFPKIREIDGLLTANISLRSQLFETHPELVFRTIKNAPLDFAKKTAEGANERTTLLRSCGLQIIAWPKIRGAAQDDIIDAAACLVTAQRLSSGKGTSFPQQPALDSYGIPIAIWA